MVFVEQHVFIRIWVGEFFFFGLYQLMSTKHFELFVWKYLIARILNNALLKVTVLALKFWILNGGLRMSMSNFIMWKIQNSADRNSKNSSNQTCPYKILLIIIQKIINQYSKNVVNCTTIQNWFWKVIIQNHLC